MQRMLILDRFHLGKREMSNCAHEILFNKIFLNVIFAVLVLRMSYNVTQVF